MSKILPVILAVVITLILIPLIGSAVSDETACIPVTTTEDLIDDAFTINEADEDVSDFMEWLGYWAGTGTTVEFSFMDEDSQIIYADKWTFFTEQYVDLSNGDGVILHVNYNPFSEEFNFDPAGLFELYGTGDVLVIARQEPH